MHAPTTTPMTMTSREIAELTGKEHAHVARDTRTMLDDLGLTAEGYLQNWRHPQNGQTYTEFALPKDLTLTLVTGYSVPLRHRIVTRWIELESQQVPAVPAAPQTPAVPASFREALLLAAERLARLGFWPKIREWG